MKRLLGVIGLKLFGWKTGEEPPTIDKYVLIASPHTTNWDFFFMMLIAFYHGMRISWMGKKDIFRWPWGWFFRMLGGVAVNRKGNHNIVQQMAKTFSESERMILVVPASGTRSYRDYWKSGFYYIAKGAEVPIVPGYLDYEKKQGGFGPPLLPSEDISADMDVFRDFYKDIKGKFPKKTSRIRLRIEDEPNQEKESSVSTQAETQAEGAQ